MIRENYEIIREAKKARRFQGIQTMKMGMQLIDLALKWRSAHEKHRADN